MRRAVRAAAGAGVAAVVAGVVAVAAAGLGGNDDSPAASASTLPPATTKVTRMTLTQAERVDGTLGYGSKVTVNGRGDGTLTWLPAAGARISRGQPVYRADNVPVPLWYGRLPLYRSLEAGVSSGPDVKEVEQNLAALGYTGFTVDDEYTSATASAVREWQEDQGMTETGTLEPSALVLAAGPIRVAAVAAALGGKARGEVLTYTTTVRVVTIALNVSKQSLVKHGTSAVVTLPDGKTVKGKVSNVGNVITTSSDGKTSTIDVTVDLADQSRLGKLNQAPVYVSLVSAKAENVLTVPVAALVVLAEGGGYGVQVVSGSRTSYVPVKTGMFAGGRVEISGQGITADTVVGMPA
jgi:peptidoglycan hydrolase-like protein with peptidoglycan-binding domain